MTELTRLIDPDKSRAVFIATAVYPDDEGIDDLPQVRDGVLAARDALTGPDGGFSVEHCLLFTDPNDPAMLTEQILRTAADATDALLVYYAGHGLLGPPAESLYLACARSTRHQPHLRSLPVNWVHDAMRKSPAANRLLIVDSCYSGHALHGTRMADPATVGAKQLAVDDIDGQWTLASSAADMPSFVRDRFSGLTGALLDVLANGLPFASELLTLDNIFSGVRSRMHKQGLPPPVVSSTLTVGRLALARNVAYSTESPGGLGEWWQGVTVHHSPPNAGAASQWITKRRQKGGYFGAYFEPYLYRRQFAKQRMWREVTQWHRGIRFDRTADAAQALLGMAAWDVRFAAFMVCACSTAMEPNVAKVLRVLVTEERESAVTLLREILAEYPGKTVRLCREAQLAIPPVEWFHVQRVDPPTP